MNCIQVLDHGFIRLVDSMGSDLSISRNARVSYDAEWRAGEDSGSDSRLINYLYENGHNTPFEAVTFTFDIKAPIFVFRQWHRHRTQSYNELSARYKELPQEFYVPDPLLLGVQSPDNKQMRIVGDSLTKEQLAEAEYSCYMMKKQNESSYKVYQELLKAKVPRELARSVLPVSMYSHMFATMNLHNLFKFLAERLHPHAQHEIRLYAEALLQLIEPICPVAVKAFKTHTLKITEEISPVKTDSTPPIDHTEMVKALAKSGDLITNELTGAQAHILHMAIGISGEAFELLEAHLNDDKDNLLEELGDIEFYITGLNQCFAQDPVVSEELTVMEVTPITFIVNQVLITAGEVLDKAKRIAIYQKDNQEAYDALYAALLNFRHCLDEYYAKTGISRETALHYNIAKLGERYKGFTYSNDAASERADKK